MIRKTKIALKTLPLFLLPIVIFGATAFAQSCEAGNAAACLETGQAGKIMQVLSIILTFLAGGVGVFATMMLIAAGVQYSASNGDPQGVAAAKKKIGNVIVGLVSFIFLWAFLQWLVPGGVWLP